MAEALMSPKPMAVAWVVRLAPLQLAKAAKRATISPSPTVWITVPSRNSAPKLSSQLYPNTGPTRAMMTAWNQVRPSRNRCLLRHTSSGKVPPKGTRDQRLLTIGGNEKCLVVSSAIRYLEEDCKACPGNK